jgi:recombination protein recR
MDEQEFGSHLLADAVSALCKLPGVGRRTAMRYILSLQMRPVAEQQEFITSIQTFITEVQRCPLCNNFSDDGQPCALCADVRRDPTLLCIVADVRDLLAIQQANVFQGGFFVLGSLINPLKGIGPDQLPFAQLVNRINAGVEEVIFAFPNSTDADLTVFFLQKKLENLDLRISVLARGIPFGNSVEQTDDTTISLAFEKRTFIRANSQIVDPR